MLKTLAQDESVTKNIQKKITQILTILASNASPALRISQALHVFEDVSEQHVDSFTREQLYNAATRLEQA